MPIAGRNTQLVVAAVAAALVVGCGDPLASLPADTTVHTYLDLSQEAGFANLWVESAACLQLPADTSIRFAGVEPAWFALGGRGTDPLSAYVALNCNGVNASWEQVDTTLAAPYRFEIASGETTLGMEIDDEGAVTLCEFPVCVFDALTPRPPPVRP